MSDSHQGRGFLKKKVEKSLIFSDRVKGKGGDEVLDKGEGKSSEGRGGGQGKGKKKGNEVLRRGGKRG